MNDPQSAPTRPLMLPAVEAARLLGIPLSTLNLERRRGHIPAKKISNGYWYNRAMLENYAATMEGTPHEHTGAQAPRRLDSLRRLRGSGSSPQDR